MTFKSITPAALYERVQAGEALSLIDVRSRSEYDTAHATGARSVPLDTLNKAVALASGSADPGQPLYVICWSGARSTAACAKLVQQGVQNVVNVEGGTQAWQQAGLPVEGSGGSSAARWFRIGGLLGAAVCLILGVAVSPAFAIGAAGIWLALVLTGNAPCCSSGACSTGRGG